MPIDLIEEWIAENLGIAPGAQEKIAITLAILLGLWILRRLALALVYRNTTDHKARYQWQKGTGYVAWLLGLFVIGRIWFEGFDSIATYLGLVSAGIAIALKDPIANVAGWLFIIWRRPFEVGDRIQVGSHAGDVIDQRMFQFTVLEIGNWVDADQSTGRIIHLPNSKVFTEEQANYSKAFYYIWDELPVYLTFDSDWRKAKEILNAIATDQDDLQETAERRVREASRRYMIYYNKLTPIVYTRVDRSGVKLTVRYLCEPRRRRARQEQLWEAILDAFQDQERIRFAYPAQRIQFENLPGRVDLPRGDD